MSGATKNQHYIPQFYLKLFTDDNERFCVYNVKDEILLTRQHPRNFAAKRYFYDTNKDDLEKILAESFQLYPNLRENIDLSDEQFVEKYFSRSEAQTKLVLDKINQNPMKLWTEENMQRIVIFLHDLCIRTEFIRKNYEYINRTHNDFLDKLNYPNKEKHKKFDEKETQLRQIFSVSEYIKTARKLVENYDWFIGDNTSNINFIIGDNPAFGVFLGMNDICFPISRKRAIILRAKNHNGSLFSKDNSMDGKTINLSVDSVYMYNNIQIAYSYRYYFGDKQTIVLLNQLYKIANVNLNPKRNF